MLLDTSETFTVPEFPLELGGCLSPMTTAYETWGTLASGADNAILLCHGYTSSPHAAGDAEGWWSPLIGPGKAIDTDHYFVICSNMIGSAYGSSGPASINPETGRPFGPDFPALSTADMVDAQRRLLAHLGVQNLAAVIGYSYGGHLAFAWGETHPDMMRALVVVASGIKGRAGISAVTALQERFSACEGWNGGHFYSSDPTASVRRELKAQRLETLRGYGLGESLHAKLGTQAAADRQLDRLAGEWSEAFDPNSLIALRRAIVEFDARPHASKIKAPVLYVLARSDALFPPDLAKPTMELLDDAGVTAQYHEIDSDFGHTAPSADWSKWGPELRIFLNHNAKPRS